MKKIPTFYLKIFTCMFACMLAILLAVSNQITEHNQVKSTSGSPAAPIMVMVDGEPLDLSAVPVSPYADGDNIMVPLKEISGHLGYNLVWLREGKSLAVENKEYSLSIVINEDGYWRSHKTMLGMSVPVFYDSPAVMPKQDHIFVPARMFELLFCSVTESEDTVSLVTNALPNKEYNDIFVEFIK